MAVQTLAAAALHHAGDLSPLPVFAAPLGCGAGVWEAERPPLQQQWGWEPFLSSTL